MQSLIIRRKVIENRYLKETLVRILLKQLDYSLSIFLRLSASSTITSKKSRARNLIVNY